MYNTLYNNILKVVDINFLCLKKDYRKTNLCPLLIKEITRLSNLEGIFQAIYTGPRNIHKPFSEANYYHRLINIDNLVDSDFLSFSEDTKNFMKNYYKIENNDYSNFQNANETEFEEIKKLIEFNDKKMSLAKIFSDKEFKYFYCFSNEFINNYVYKVVK